MMGEIAISTPRHPPGAYQSANLAEGSIWIPYLGVRFALEMLSVLIEWQYSYPALRQTTGTPGIATSRSSRTVEVPPQESKRLHRIESELSHDVLNPARVPL